MSCIAVAFAFVWSFTEFKHSGYPSSGNEYLNLELVAFSIPRAHAHDCPQYPYILYRETITTLDYEKQ